MAEDYNREDSYMYVWCPIYVKGTCLATYADAPALLLVDSTCSAVRFVISVSSEVLFLCRILTLGDNRTVNIDVLLVSAFFVISLPAGMQVVTQSQQHST